MGTKWEQNGNRVGTISYDEMNSLIHIQKDPFTPFLPTTSAVPELPRSGAILRQHHHPPPRHQQPGTVATPSLNPHGSTVKQFDIGARITRVARLAGSTYWGVGRAGPERVSHPTTSTPTGPAW